MITILGQKLQGMSFHLQRDPTLHPNTLFTCAHTRQENRRSKKRRVRIKWRPLSLYIMSVLFVRYAKLPLPPPLHEIMFYLSDQAIPLSTLFVSRHALTFPYSSIQVLLNSIFSQSNLVPSPIQPCFDPISSFIWLCPLSFNSIPSRLTPFPIVQPCFLPSDLVSFLYQLHILIFWTCSFLQLYSPYLSKTTHLFEGESISWADEWWAHIAQNSPLRNSKFLTYKLLSLKFS
jgi:hypothetical protein